VGCPSGVEDFAPGACRIVLLLIFGKRSRPAQGDLLHGGSIAASGTVTVLQNLPTYPNGIRSVRFLLHRAMSRRPSTCGRSADRGLSTGPLVPTELAVPCQVPRRVLVAVQDKTARATTKHPARKTQTRAHTPAPGAPPRGWKIPRGDHKLRAVPRRLVAQLADHLSPSHVRNAPRQIPVSHHLPHRQILHDDHRLGFRQHRRELVDRIHADVPDLSVQPRQSKGVLATVLGALLLARKLPTTPPQKLQLRRKWLRRLITRPIRESGEAAQPHIHTHHRPLNRNRIRPRPLHTQRNKPPIRFPPNPIRSVEKSPGRGGNCVPSPGVNPLARSAVTLRARATCARGDTQRHRAC